MDERADIINSVTVSWDAPSQAVVLRFLGYAEGDALRIPSNQVIDLLIAKRTSRLISDSRDMKALTQEDQRWADEDWKPRAKAAGLRQNAILLPKSAVGRLSLTAVLKKFDDVQFGYFSEMEEARRWFNQM